MTAFGLHDAKARFFDRDLAAQITDAITNGVSLCLNAHSILKLAERNDPAS